MVSGRRQIGVFSAVNPELYFILGQSEYCFAELASPTDGSSSSSSYFLPLGLQFGPFHHTFSTNDVQSFNPVLFEH